MEAANHTNYKYYQQNKHRCAVCWSHLKLYLEKENPVEPTIQIVLETNVGEQPRLYVHQEDAFF